MRLRFLGTGTSFGIPVVGCHCAACSSPDPRDRRTRHGAVVESDDGQRRFLVDTPPELRLQLLATGVDTVQGVWFTHEHADHLHGIDDLRVFSNRLRRPLPAYAGEEYVASLNARFRYIFDADYRPPEGTTRPEVALCPLRHLVPVELAGFRVTPLRVPHGELTAYGFRVGELGYITDAKSLPDDVAEVLHGVRVLVLNALWFGRPHPGHFNVEEAVDAAARIGAPRTYLVHLTHRVVHADLEARLPDSVRPAYDGLVIDI